MLHIHDSQINAPLHFSVDVFVVHEALDINGDGSRIGGHLFFQLLALVQKALPGARLSGGVDFIFILEFLSEMFTEDAVESSTRRVQIVRSAQHLKFKLINQQ